MKRQIIITFDDTNLTSRDIQFVFNTVQDSVSDGLDKEAVYEMYCCGELDNPNDVVYCVDNYKLI